MGEGLGGSGPSGHGSEAGAADRTGLPIEDGAASVRRARAILPAAAILVAFGVSGCNHHAIVADARFATLSPGTLNSGLSEPGMVYYVDLKARRIDKVGEVVFRPDEVRFPTETSTTKFSDIQGISVAASGGPIGGAQLGEIKATIESETVLSLTNHNTWRVVRPSSSILPEFRVAVADESDPWHIASAVANPEGFHFVISSAVFADSAQIYFGTAKDTPNGFDLDIPGLGAAKLVYKGGSESAWQGRGRPVIVSVYWFKVRSTPEGPKYRTAEMTREQLEAVRSILRGE